MRQCSAGFTGIRLVFWLASEVGFRRTLFLGSLSVSYLARVSAQLIHVTRARVTQIMNLLLLAPDIQEAILFLTRTVKGRDPIRERHIRPIAAEIEWRRQRDWWGRLAKIKWVVPADEAC